MSNEDNPAPMQLAGLENLPVSTLQRLGGDIMRILQARAYALAQETPDTPIHYLEIDFSVALTAARIVAFNTMGAPESKPSLVARADSKLHTLVGLFKELGWTIEQMQAVVRAFAEGMQETDNGVVVPDLTKAMKAAPDAFGGESVLDAMLAAWEAQTNLALEAMASRVTTTPCDCPRCKERRGDLSYKATHEGGRA